MKKIIRYLREVEIKAGNTEHIELPIGNIITHIDIIGDYLESGDKIQLILNKFQFLVDTVYSRWDEIYPPPNVEGDERYVMGEVDTMMEGLENLELRIHNRGEIPKKIIVQVIEKLEE